MGGNSTATPKKMSKKPDKPFGAATAVGMDDTHPRGTLAIL
jgi:hypothetical protein